MKWTQIPLGVFQTNCYVLANESGEALIIDPGDEPEKVNKVIHHEGIKPLAILLTHAHLDHIGAVDVLRDEWKIPVYIHQEESDWLGEPEKNGSLYFEGVEPIKLKPADHVIKGETDRTIGGFRFFVFETPGHSPGSVSFYFADHHVVFSGDALFYGSIGRTDLYGGDAETLLSSIETKLLTLPEETVVAPGHGLETTIGHEKLTNPFLV
ncbi:MBL fold metallo-hydrolase [Pullulanibacillus sp. KACC 23026]|uniref:MBL fold metallo-hydrolase n=1 Tax=Pullulanibacillus sp. KACC 23026 TaxID=3028315 RepID=UPI0023B19C8D|nr:MBL fold metallo-hydrolase [Pullulanibacillus sp. KACC 23026]WEG14279.1 MBL fold metallo-hydrolase [Pullulanibacillus sp. KACC 23026]